MPIAVAVPESVPGRHRGSIALRGILALIVGGLLLARPASGVVALYLLFVALFLVDGGVSIGMGLWHIRSDRRWWAWVLQGVVGLGIAALALVWPGATVLLLVWLTGAWAIWQGISELLLAQAVPAGRILLSLGGIFSLLLGILMIAIPAAGVIGLVALLAAYALLRGVTLLVVAARLRPGA